LSSNCNNNNNFTNSLLDSNDLRLDFIIEDCKDTQIKLYLKKYKDDEKKITYCDNPICSNCGDPDHSICLPNNININDVNDPKNNICQCVNGWTGKGCSTQLFYEDT